MEAPAPPEVLGLLADPLRWHLLVELGRSDRRVGELVERTGKAQNLVSYHLGELRRGGIVTSRRSSADGRDVYYRADLRRCGELLGAAGSALHPGLHRSEPTTQSRPTGGPRRRTPRVLFLCTGNSGRSQIAEALLAQRSAGGVEARSAGSHPKPLHPEAVRAMAARGIDIADHEPKPVTRFARSGFDRVVTLCDKVREVCPDLPGAPVAAHWSMADPAAAGDADAVRAAFAAVADDVDGRVELLLADLTTETT